MADVALRAQVINRLIESKELHGKLLPGEAERAARVLKVSDSTIYRLVKNGTSEPLQRRHYEAQEADLVALFQAAGNARLAWEIRRAEDPSVPSESTFRRALDRVVDSVALETAKSGIKGRDAARIVLERGPFLRNEMWEGDHTQLEIAVVAKHAKQPVRPWLTWFIDAGSRYVVGWALSTERPTRGTVLSTIRMGVSKLAVTGCVYGRPEMLVWDNGAEFLADAVTEAGTRLGCRTLNTYPYSPEQKGLVERLNLTIETGLLQRLPHYSKGPVQKDGTLYWGDSDYLSLETFVEMLASWIHAYNSERPHRSLAGRTPESVWLSDPTPVVEIENEDVRYFTLERLDRKVRRDGGVHVDGVAYVAPELIGLESKTVEVGRVPYDPASIEIFFEDKWVCTATPTARMSEAQRSHFYAERKAQNARLGVLRRKATTKVRIAPITPLEPEPRVLGVEFEPDRGPQKSLAALLGMSDEIGEVE